MKTFRFNSLAYLIFISLIFPGLIIALIIFYTKIHHPFYLLMSGAIALGTIALIMRGLRKIIVNEQGVEFIGIRDRYIIYWSEIKSVGVFMPTKYKTYKLDDEELNKCFFYGQRFIYISTDAEPELKASLKGNFIFLEYRKAIYTYIIELYKRKNNLPG